MKRNSISDSETNKKQKIDNLNDNFNNIEYLEQSLDKLAELPIELKRQLTLIGQLDERVNTKREEINQITGDFLKGTKKTAEQRRQFHEQASKLFNAAREFTDDKISYATKAYDTVDNYIRKLDSDLELFEADLRSKAKEQGLNVDHLIQLDNEHKSNLGGVSALAHIFPQLGQSEQSIKDMPIDPNEPTYCLCKKVSYGEMIGCDNDDCLIEWFHLSCVGLTKPPPKNQKWYCSKCLPEMEAKKKEAERRKSISKSGRRLSQKIN